MVFTNAYSSFTSSGALLTSGLVGTVGVRILDGSGNTIKSRTTSGIVETPSGSGFYIATIDLTTLTSAPAAGHYYLFWDDGSVTPGHVAAEDLYIAKQTTLASALRELKNTTLSHSAENINVGFFFG